MIWLYTCKFLFIKETEYRRNHHDNREIFAENAVFDLMIELIGHNDHYDIYTTFYFVKHLINTRAKSTSHAELI